MKREVIFEMPNTYGTYRVVCQFGYDEIVYYAWWGYVQRKKVKKSFWTGKEKEIWKEVARCWWSHEITSMEQLKLNATKLYDDNIEMPIRIQQRAMKL